MARSLYQHGEAPPIDAGPQRLAYPCRAARCPMPGTIFDGGQRGVCAWHFGSDTGSSFVHVTQVLTDWEPLAAAINRCRSFCNDPSRATDVKAQAEALREAWAELVPFVAGSGWKPRLEPVAGETYGGWGRRLEHFLVARVKGERADERNSDTAGVAEMRKHVRGALPASIGAGDWDGP